VCECADGWEGVNCQVNIDECASIPCEHNSKCVDKVKLARLPGSSGNGRERQYTNQSIRFLFNYTVQISTVSHSNLALAPSQSCNKRERSLARHILKDLETSDAQCPKLVSRPDIFTLLFGIIPLLVLYHLLVYSSVRIMSLWL